MAALISSPSRAASFCAGRAALHSALRACGVDDVAPVFRDGNGAPQLPDGVLASISHTHGLAASIARLAAPGAAREALGLDVERVGREFAPRLALRVLTPTELAQVEAEAEQGSSARCATLVRFSLKEALYKALYQVGAHNGVAFRDVSLRPLLDGSASCEWEPGARELECTRWAVSLRWAVLCDYYVSTAHVRRLDGA